MSKPKVAGGMALATVFLVAVPVLAAFSGLPSSGAQVNKDATNGIDPARNGGATDVVGGTLTVGGTEVPWITFEQKAAVGQHIFVRSFTGGAWHTKGQSLNIDAGAEAEAPAIDFAGPKSTVPWVTWYEPSSDFGGHLNVFASRFCATTNTICGAQNVWIPEGRDRSSGNLVPTLNIHPRRDAENPSVAGGTLIAGGDPVPWIAWQEEDGNVNSSGPHDQIFVSKAVKNASAGAACPVGTKPGGGNSVSFFCWQEVGKDRLNASGGATSPNDASLNIDPSRNGIEPDNAFTGPSDTVPWVVWYETGNSHIGLRGNDQVFAAKMVSGSGDGGGIWQAVGRGTTGLTETLDNTGAKHFGACSASTSAEDLCSLNKVATHNAEDVRVAAGTLVSGNPTVPWVVWTEDVGGGTHAIFISRLVGGDHFELFNAGQPISNITRNAHNPDIVFFGNEPVVSWVEDFPNGHHRDFVGHFTGGAASPQFHLDTANGVHLLPSTTVANVTNFRQPIASTCQAIPTTNDGSACPGGVKFFFFSFTEQGSPRKIFAQRQ